MIRSLLAPLLIAGSASAQGLTIPDMVLDEIQTEVSGAPGAVIRAIDKMTGDISDLEVGVRDIVTYGRLSIRLGDCRYPTENPSLDAFAWIDIIDDTQSNPVFSGWMIASSPALNAMDHPRYDVWVLRCIIS